MANEVKLYAATLRDKEGKQVSGTMMVAPRAGGGKHISFYTERKADSWRPLEIIDKRHWRNKRDRTAALREMGIVEFSELPRVDRARRGQHNTRQRPART